VRFAPPRKAWSFPKGKGRICKYNADSVLRSYPFWEKDSQNLGCPPRARKGLGGNARGILGGDFLGREKRKTKPKTENQIEIVSAISLLVIVQV
jgi:hypothetical protein